MCIHVIQVFYIEREDLRVKYHTQTSQRVTAMCKAIGKYTQSQITFQEMKSRILKFEIIGNRIDSTKEQILFQLCQVTIKFIWYKSVKFLIVFYSESLSPSMERKTQIKKF